MTIIFAAVGAYLAFRVAIYVSLHTPWTMSNELVNLLVMGGLCYVGLKLQDDVSWQTVVAATSLTEVVVFLRLLLDILGDVAKLSALRHSVPGQQRRR